MNRVIFKDYQELSVKENTSPMKETPEGFLTGRCCVTCAGVYVYGAKELGLSGEGTYNVLRPAEEIRATCTQLANKVITAEHPQENVSPENSKILNAGFTGDSVTENDGNVFTQVTITDKVALDLVRQKKLMAFSCGYSAELSKVPGVWHGTPYDFVQSNFIYNHIALVEEGRAGDGVRIPFADGVNTKETKMAQLFHDGVVLEATPEVVNLVTSLKKNISDSAKVLEEKDKKLSDAEIEKQKLLAAKDSAEAKLQSTQKLLDARVFADTTAKAVSLGVKVENLDMAGIRAAVVQKAFGDSVQMKDKPDAYCDAMYDAALASLAKSPVAAGGNTIAGGNQNFGDATAKLADARQKAWDRANGVPAQTNGGK